MRLIVSGGGTGGHVYPGLAVVEALLESDLQRGFRPAISRSDVVWIGSKGGLEQEMVTQAGLQFAGLPAGGLRGVGLLTSAQNAVRIASSVRRARLIMSEFEPDVVLVTGGYACVSVTLAARADQVPVLIYLPDIVPGMAIRFLSRFAAKIAVTSEESYQHLRQDKVVVTGYPVRKEFFTVERDEARRRLMLDPDELVLLVFGGSRGARSINRAIVSGLAQLLECCSIVHVSGRLDADWIAGMAKRLPEGLRARYHHYAYLHDMPLALLAADLAVARAGAATMGEFPAASLPAILVPYPHSGAHQRANAEYLVRNGAARMLLDDELDEGLIPAILGLLSDRDELQKMRESTRAMHRQDAASAIARQLWQLARQPEVSSSEAEP